jgi:hypothetical protein
MAVDVVVVNYKTDDLLQNFIASFEASFFAGCTLTIMDVEANNGENKVVGNHIYNCTATNIGYGAACNRGAAGGKNDVILLANADTLLTEGLEECYHALIHPLNESWGVLGPRQVDDQGRITAGGIEGPDKSPHQLHWQELDVGQASGIMEDAFSVSGALYFIKREVWDELTSCPTFQQYQPDSVGAFLETPHYFDETWCSLHARSHGYKVVYYGPVQMTHLYHRSSSHGGHADQQFGFSQQMYREACAMHGITCE